MRYTKDKRGYCAKCRKEVTLVKCSWCQGKVSQFSTCGDKNRVCNSTGYQCENTNGDRYHKWWS